ncbi:MAG: ABC transporter permease [Elusimicrobiota bacterium]
MTSDWDRWVVLLGIELKSVRESWGWVLGLSALYPLSLLFLMKFSGAATPQAAARILSGGIVFSVALNSALALGQELSGIRESASFDFYAGLPVGPLQVVAAILVRNVLLSLPAAIGVAVLGAAFLSVPLPSLVWALPYLLLTCAALAGAGALIGFYAPSARAANMMTQAGYMVVVFFSPLMFPVQALPPGVRFVAYLFPTTYAADALQLLIASKGFDSRLALDAAVLAGFSILSYLSLRGRLRWSLD